MSQLLTAPGTAGSRWAAGTLVTATVCTGLLAGLLYGYACSVMPGLARTDDRTFVEAMRGINVAIVNPVFMLSFLGAPAATAVAAFLNRGGPAGRWALAALVLNVLVLVVSAAANIPLNDRLERTGDRAAFEHAWVVWHIVRTVAATTAFGSLVATLLTRDR